MQDYIHLKDITLEKLKARVLELLGDMEIPSCSIYKHKLNKEFILTFPKGISNETFIFFYCALMAPDIANSNELLGWFSANDDMTIYEQKGDFCSFKKATFTKKIMITPEGDDKGSMHQYGISEDGKEIHFGMDGTFEIMENTSLTYTKPLSSLIDFLQIESIENQLKQKEERPIKAIERDITLVDRIKNLFGL